MRDFYNPAKVISHNANMSMIVSMRTYGKTYAFTKAAVKDWLRDRSQFVWVRRYERELNECKDTLFDDVIFHNEFPQLEFRVEGYKAMVRFKPKSDNKKDKTPWDVIGHFCSLSRQQSYKGKAYPRVKKIIFDEFIRELKTPPGYLRDEMGSFFNLFKTVSRDRKNVRAYLLANACDLVNPYFTFYKIFTEPKDGFSWYHNKKVLVEYAKNATFADEERKTVVGELVSGTAYEGVMINNIFANADASFIAKKPKNAKFHYSVEFQGQKFGIWYDPSDFMYYINRKTVNVVGRSYVLSAQDMRPDLEMIGRFSPFAKSLVMIFSSGGLRFDTQATREQFVKMLSLCGLR